MTDPIQTANSPWAQDYVPGDIVAVVSEENFDSPTLSLEEALIGLGIAFEDEAKAEEFYTGVPLLSSEHWCIDEEDDFVFEDLPQELQDEVDAMLGADLELDGTEATLDELLEFYAEYYPKTGNLNDNDDV